MTEKELKKLIRLELLELLLEASNENHELKNRIEKLTTNLDTARSIEQLSTAIDQVEKVLAQANRLSDTATAVLPAVIPQSGASGAEASSPTPLDKAIYERLLLFYSENAPLLAALPLELQIAIKERTPSVLNKLD